MRNLCCDFIPSSVQCSVPENVAETVVLYVNEKFRLDWKDRLEELKKAAAARQLTWTHYSTTQYRRPPGSERDIAYNFEMTVFGVSSYYLFFEPVIKRK